MPDFLAVVSDTHGQVEFARRAVRLLEPFQPICLIHCGDIGSPAIPSLFANFEAHYVLGNVDHYDEPTLAAAIQTAGQKFAGRFGQMTILGKKIAWLHGDDERLLQQTIASGRYDLVCSGHTHRQEQRSVGKTLALNPGALFRANPRTCAVVDLADLSVTVLKCE
jgi:putative phosphoesterase